MKLNVPFYRQEHSHTCGPAGLRMVLEFFGTALTESELAQRCGTTLLGTGRVGLAQAATALGFAAQLVNHLTRDDVETYLNQGRPIIAVIDPGLLYPGVLGFAHSVVMVGLEGDTVIYHDPESAANLTVSWGQFQMAWDRHDRKGVILWKP